MKQGEIHMGGGTIPGEYILPKIIRNFREEHPLVSVVLSISDTNDIKGRVLNGHLELGIEGTRGSHRNLIHHKLWKDELVLATSKEKEDI